LLCRILDTIEDAQWVDFAAQARAFSEFDHFIDAAPVAEAIDTWRACFPTGLPEGELILLRDAERIFSDFHSWPAEMRVPVGRLILSMSAGMRHYMKKKAAAGRLRLTGAADVNRYCFFVAGLVGEILVRLTGRFSSENVDRLKDAFRFGLFLQKVNLLKDQRGDEEWGRFLVPSRPKLLSSLLSDAEGAIRFLTDLPEREKGFRLFCAWSLFLGLASLPWIQLAESEGLTRKISREETAQLLELVEERIQDNGALRELFDLGIGELTAMAQSESESESESKAANAEPATIPARSPDAAVEENLLLAFYQGELPRADVLEIFNG
jgi:hypothetical protein